MQATVILGSNSGNSLSYLQQARRLLENRIGKLICCSSIYETAPWGFQCEQNFLNQVCLLETSLTPEAVLSTALEIEKELGRVRSEHCRYTSRTIDIDLLFCDDIILNTAILTLPHPRLAERNFVLVPLNEIMPRFMHPTLHKTVHQLLAECPDKLEVKKHLI